MNRDGKHAGDKFMNIRQIHTIAYYLLMIFGMIIITAVSGANLLVMIPVAIMIWITKTKADLERLEALDEQARGALELLKRVETLHKL